MRLAASRFPTVVIDSVETFPDNLKARPPAGDNGNGYQYSPIASAYAVVNIAAGAPQRFGIIAAQHASRSGFPGTWTSACSVGWSSHASPPSSGWSS